MSRMAPKAATAWRALIRETDRRPPACQGDERFIGDPDVTPEHVQDSLKAICDTCPIFGACKAYAATDRPTGTLWAGRYWGRKERS